jgi:hypothetical protein
MGVMVKFVQSGAFNSGEFKSLELDKITDLKIAHQRNGCELQVTTPENPQPGSPYIIAKRDKDYLLQDILNDLLKLKNEKREVIYEITDDGTRVIQKV